VAPSAQPLPVRPLPLSPQGCKRVCFTADQRRWQPRDHLLTPWLCSFCIVLSGPLRWHCRRAVLDQWPQPPSRARSHPAAGGGKRHTRKAVGSRAAPAGRAPMTRGQPLSEEDRGHTLTNQRPQLQRSLGILRQAGSGALQLAHHQDTSRHCRSCDDA